MVGFYGSVWELLGWCYVLVGFGFLGFFPIFSFSLSSFLSFGVLLYTSCVLGLRSSAFFNICNISYKKKKYLHENVLVIYSSFSAPFLAVSSKLQSFLVCTPFSFLLE